MQPRFIFPSYQGGDTETVVARVPPDEIGYLGAIVESYEGIGIMRTRDPQFGIVEFWIIPEFRDVFRTLLDDLKKETEIEVLDIPPASRL